MAQDLYLITEGNKGNEGKKCRRIGAVFPFITSVRGYNSRPHLKSVVQEFKNLRLPSFASVQFPFLSSET